MQPTAKQIVLAAFIKNEGGELVPAFNPRLIDSVDTAKRDAARLNSMYFAGVVAWVREPDPLTGRYGPAAVIYQRGETPDLL
jgi:hypothetical protein